MIDDPIRGSTEPGRYWTFANTGEATTDILSPLCWSIWGHNLELASRQAFHDFGIMAKRDVRAGDDPNEMITSCFYGRQAMNIDLLRDLMGSIPGTSGDDFERDLVGHLRDGLPPSTRTLRRLPFIALKSPLVLLRNTSAVEAFAGAQRTWWQASVASVDAGSTDPLAALTEAADRFRAAMHLHVRTRFLLQSAQAQLTELVTRSGTPELMHTIFGGFGGTSEGDLTADLWQVARGGSTIETFIARHGYHGPHEGNITGRSWRENPEPLQRVVAELANRPDTDDPAHRVTSARRAHVEAVAALAGRLGRRDARRLRRQVDSCAALVRATELGKASFVMALDAARAATRALGRELVAAGVIDDPDDVVHFGLPELQAGLPAGSRDIVAFRTARREAYRALRLPTHFTGMPEPIEADSVAHDGVVAGLGVSVGVVEGVARVVVDPADTEPLEPGEVLVCAMTDPSWAALFTLAEALVIDIGGPASHGAIVARELGIPCVIATGDGTSRIRTGDRVVVDGTAGTVTVHPVPAFRQEHPHE